ncbi:MAG: Gfo/Idh/MocA family oxidoreductase [Deltaproteobacteria bacterium]|nr:Gfo/Idh/MocA family oxidoreductase [Deltaproteobacteria bacterium]
MAKDTDNPILLIANPPGLHSIYIEEAARSGFKAVVVEKPSCVRHEEISVLEKVKIPVAVCHIYRQMWGPQTLKAMIDSGEMGEIISIEGRYWQSSTAQRALTGEKTKSWKNDPQLSGEYDALLDVGTHWVDVATFLIGEMPRNGSVWLSYANAEAAHRDSHVHLNLEFSKGRRVMSSISKTFHGATNHFEINVIGTLKSATWTFLDPDEIWIGQGNQKSTLTRKSTILGSCQPVFHGMGWLEGYIEIFYQLFKELSDEPFTAYPNLRDNLAMLKSLMALKRN